MKINPKSEIREPKEFRSSKSERKEQEVSGAYSIRQTGFRTSHFALRTSHFRRAFTLIELILAVGIMAVVLVAINGVFFTALRLRERTAVAVDDALPIQTAFTIMRRDLQCAKTPGGTLSGSFKVGNITDMTSGQAVAIELYTTTGVLLEDQPWGDIQKVTYGLKDPEIRTELGGKDLVRSITRNLLNTLSPEVEDQWMMSDVADLSFECFDGASWMNTWDTTIAGGNTNLPNAVRVRIHLADISGNPRDAQPVELVVPILLQSLTNLTQTIASAEVSQ